MLVGSGIQHSKDARQQKAGQGDAPTSRLCAYEFYKPSGVPRLGDVPVHWEVRRLRTIADMRVSSVDKHTKEGEIPVRLCNYVDVYKNDRITSAMPFMAATASRDEIERFRLESGDVLITKDSETWDDIGIPALVAESAHDLLSGYHLALLRPTTEILGSYLARTLQSKGVAYQFHIRANGVTRYGLTHTGIQSVQVPLPPLPEQTAIIRYLDYVDWRIRRYVSAKRKLIALLEEEKQAVVNRAVTRGLDSKVRHKPSGVEWLGDVPEHWAVGSLKRFAARRPGAIKAGPFGSQLTAAEMTEAGFKVYTQRNVIDRDLEKGFNYISNAKFHALRAFEVIPGDVLVTSRGTIGRTVLVTEDCEPGVLHPCLLRIQPDHGHLLPEFLMTLIQDSQLLRQQLTFLSNATTIDVIYSTTLANITVPVPPLPEQTAIVKYLDKATTNMDAATARARRQIELLQEYRTRLIADVVTGKLDVREAAAQLPDETDDQDPIDRDGLVLDNMDDGSSDVSQLLEEEQAMEREVTA